MTHAEHVAPGAGLEEALRAFPSVLENLGRIYTDLERRAERVEEELVRTNAALEGKLAELEALRRHLEAVLEALPCGVIERAANGRIVRVNDSTARMLGVGRDALVGASDHPALPPEATAGEPRELVRANGERLVLVSHYATVRSSEGEVEGTLEILDDRTVRTALQERLHANDKMAALGTLAAGVAHEIRNPLNAVKGFASLIQTLDAADAEDAAQIREWAGHIVAGSTEMDGIIQNMLTFGSPERLVLEAIDGAALVERAIEAALRGKQERLGLAITVECTAPPFRGDRIKLRQALRNLIANAARVQPEGGAIHVALGLEEDEIVAVVGDAGPGVPDGLRHRILDPFFTTDSEGTGLGLALVSTIARLHGGVIEVSPERSHLGGARFLLRIPYQPDVESGATQFPRR